MALERYCVGLCLGFVLTGCGRANAPRPEEDAGVVDLGSADGAVDASLPVADAGGANDGGADDGGTVVTGTATISGEMNGYSVGTVRSVIAVVGPSSFTIYIADRADLCRILQAASSPKNTSFLRFGTIADMPQAFPAGTYTYPSGPGSGNGDGSGGGAGGADGGIMGTRNATIAATNGNCLLEGYNQAADGSFTTNAPVDGNTTTIEGTFDILFGVGAIFGEIKGSFSAPVCPGATEIPFEVPPHCE